MNDAKHQDAVERTLGALKQAEAFGVLPADCRSGSGNVGNERKNRLVLRASFAPVSIGGLHIGVPGDDAGPGGGGDARIVAGVPANVEHAMRSRLRKRALDKRSLARVIFGAVVACGSGVVAPTGGARRRCERAEGTAKLLQRSAQDFGSNLRPLLMH